MHRDAGSGAQVQQPVCEEPPDTERRSSSARVMLPTGLLGIWAFWAVVRERRKAGFFQARMMSLRFMFFSVLRIDLHGRASTLYRKVCAGLPNCRWGWGFGAPARFSRDLHGVGGAQTEGEGAQTLGERLSPRR